LTWKVSDDIIKKVEKSLRPISLSLWQKREKRRNKESFKSFLIDAPSLGCPFI
jgi:hypothetical protein